MIRRLYFSLCFLIPCCPAFAADPPRRPPCTAQTEGRFWPDEANNNPKFAAALMPYGYPEVCSVRDGHYRWRSLTVSVRKLRQDASQKQHATKRPPAEN